MRGSPWIGVAIGVFFTSLAIYEICSGKAYTKFSTELRRSSPIGFWFVVVATMALGIFALVVAARDLHAIE